MQAPLPLPLPGSARRRRLKPLLSWSGYARTARSRCFVCSVVEGDPDHVHHVLYEDDVTIAFLDKGPRLWGTVLVAPKAHLERATGDLDETSYLHLQRVIFRVGEAVRASLPCERLYVMSMGSQQLNRHVHWHIAPLPPGVPLWRQQLRAFSEILNGVIECPEEEWRRVAERLRSELGSPAR